MVRYVGLPPSLRGAVPAAEENEGVKRGEGWSARSLFPLSRARIICAHLFHQPRALGRQLRDWRYPPCRG